MRAGVGAPLRGVPRPHPQGKLNTDRWDMMGQVDPEDVLPRDLPPIDRGPRIPKRIRLRRTSGWYKPVGAIVVSRPTKWGNPFTGNPERAVEAYRAWLTAPTGSLVLPAGVRFARTLKWDEAAYLRAHLPELRGHDLACWCKESAPCHADVLLELSNTVPHA